MVLDSIASLMRTEFDSSTLQLRYHALSKVDSFVLFASEHVLNCVKAASILKFVAEAFGIPVLITNQITAIPLVSSKRAPVENEDEDEEAATLESADSSSKATKSYEKVSDLRVGKTAGLKGDIVTAALGVSWAHCVNTRLVLEFTRGDTSGKLRYLTVAKSPMAPVISFPYVITGTYFCLCKWFAHVKMLLQSRASYWAAKRTRGSIRITSGLAKWCLEQSRTDTAAFVNIV